MEMNVIFALVKKQLLMMVCVLKVFNALMMHRAVVRVHVEQQQLGYATVRLPS